jgi:hypothetical protein
MGWYDDKFAWKAEQVLCAEKELDRDKNKRQSQALALYTSWRRFEKDSN